MLLNDANTKDDIIAITFRLVIFVVSVISLVQVKQIFYTSGVEILKIRYILDSGVYAVADLNRKNSTQTIQLYFSTIFFI